MRFRSLLAVIVLVLVGTVAPASSPVSASPATPSAHWLANAGALLDYGRSIGDPDASLITDNAEAVYLRDRYCPLASRYANQQMIDRVDPDGSPESVRRANEVSMITWNGWCS